MTTDKSWITLPNRRSEAFKVGLNSFMEIAKKHVNSQGEVRCPCKICVNMYFKKLTLVRAHINDKGFDPTYKVWIYHGQEYPTSVLNNIWAPRRNTSTTNETDEMLNAIDDIIGEKNANEENIDDGGYDALLNELNTELYPGCTWMSSLNFIAKLLHIKVNNKWTDSSFDQLLELLKLAFPKENKIPSTHYDAKKKLRQIGLGYQSIHVCENDCFLFWKENESKEKCPFCKESRWVDEKTKGKKVPRKVLRYFPPTPRLIRMYSCRHTAKEMPWHKTGCSSDGNMRHPVDGSAWKEFDKRYPKFAAEPRNVRLGLAADGFNPFNDLAKPYSMWPVILTTYNTPPWLCMKESSFMLTLLIPGPRSPGKDMDVFLRPLIDELKMLWATGVQVRDAATNTVFRMHAALLWTINDFPARSSLSGWSGQGYLGCPTCNKDTPSCSVTNKIAYVGHRRFLGKRHSWRKDLAFNGVIERRAPPKRFSNAEILEQLDRLPNKIPGKDPSPGGKKRKRLSHELNWTKRSIFFELEYWSSHDLKHNIDVMHLEKNVCESVMNTALMNERSKDTINARRDLEKLNIRSNLWIQEEQNKIYKPHPPYSFEHEDRKRFCQFIKEVRLPDGFGSNFKKKVVANDSNITGLKSHDCHILMQRLLPVGVRAYLDKDTSTTIIDLCTFFKKICARTLVVQDMIEAQDELIKILCKLELIYPPAFFDIMIHLVLHLPEEAILGGPVFMRWMYPFERYMKKLKSYVRNKARPEGSIAEGYVAEEALTFCSMYLKDVQTKFNRPERNEDDGIPQRQLSVFSSQCRRISKKTIMDLPPRVKKQLEWFVLDTCNEIGDYKSQFANEQPESDLETHFPTWFYDKIYCLRNEMSPICTDELNALAHGLLYANTYTACIVNGVRFIVHSRDNNRTTQNSGVVVVGLDNSLFYGQLEEIIELHYLNKYSVVLFRCKWFNTHENGRHIKENNIVSINIRYSWYKEQPYILATQAKQVFYLQDPSRNSNWRVVEEVHHRKLWDHPSIGVVNEIDVVHDTRSSDFELVVDLGDLPMEDTDFDEIGESSVAAEPVVDNESFVNDEDQANKMYSSDEEVFDYNDDDDEFVDKSYSSDDSD